ncbi:hypothetical protein T4B_11374 [Trichinella pseudospiralis]|uniref:Uncharacterized protein n=1 Tax=Trichinella pseudospiralis TaxID=6337 RepID=A0A0V1J0T7_TRIPS|nr:hypothetical protein T4B_11374 [Trichinella pseudospiralis]
MLASKQCNQQNRHWRHRNGGACGSLNRFPTGMFVIFNSRAAETGLAAHSSVSYFICTGPGIALQESFSSANGRTTECSEEHLQNAHCLKTSSSSIKHC